MKRWSLATWMLLALLCVGWQPQLAAQEAEGELSLDVARQILSTHAMHDAVMIVPDGTWHSSPALSDLDGDGDLEIIVAVGERYMGAWHHNGLPVAGWPQPCRRIVSSPAAGDVDNDGEPEIAACGNLWRPDGRPMPGWPVGRGHSFCTSSLHDVDGDGDLEILYSDGNEGVCVRHHDGTLLPGWPVSIADNDIRSTVLAHDVDGDGEVEIVFTRRNGYVHIHRLDGSPLPGFPKVFPIPGGESFVFADVDGDGHTELVQARKAIDLRSGAVTELKGTRGGDAPCLIRDPESGKLVARGPWFPGKGHRKTWGISTEGGQYSDSAVVADIDGDGKLETLFATRGGGYHALRYKGSQAPGWPKLLTPSGDCGMAVGDLDGDGYFEVVANAAGGRIYVFGTSGPAGGQAPWPLFMANNLRNGTPDPAMVPRARGVSGYPSPTAQVLRMALASGDWDEAVGIYRSAVDAVEANGSTLGTKEAGRMKQAGILSVARVLNTRARRFAEAARLYREAVDVDPGSWLATQALAECTDLVALHPDVREARSSLDAALTAVLPTLKQIEIPQPETPKRSKGFVSNWPALKPVVALESPEDELRRYASAQAASLLERSEGVTQFTLLAETASPYLRRMAARYAEREETGIVLSVKEKRGVEVECWAKDLTPKDAAVSHVLNLLELSLESPVKEAFPVNLQLSADAGLALFLEGDWAKEADGRLYRHEDISLTRAKRVLIATRPYNGELPTITRDVERIDDTHMAAKFFFRTSLREATVGIEILDIPGNRIVPSSVTPPGDGAGIRVAEMWVHVQKAANVDLSSGLSIQATIEMPAEQKSYYPYATVWFREQAESVVVEPSGVTLRATGSFDGIDYEISSDKPFRVRSAESDRTWAFSVRKAEAGE